MRNTRQIYNMSFMPVLYNIEHPDLLAGVGRSSTGADALRVTALDSIAGSWQCEASGKSPCCVEERPNHEAIGTVAGLFGFLIVGVGSACAGGGGAAADRYVTRMVAG